MRLSEILEGLKNPKDNPCWKGYHPVGTKKKRGRTVPNCVPNESINEFAPDENPERDDSGKPEFMSWEDFIAAVANLTKSAFDVKIGFKNKKLNKTQAAAKFIPHDPFEFGPVSLYAFKDRRPPYRTGVRAHMQIGAYSKHGEQLLSQFKIPQNDLREVLMTPANATRIAHAIMKNTAGALTENINESLRIDQSTQNSRWYVVDGEKRIAGPFIERSTAERKMAEINDRRKVMSRRSFLKGAGVAGATAATGAAGYGIYKLDQYEQEQEEKLLSQVTDPQDIAKYKTLKDEYLSYQSLHLSNTKNISYSVMASDAGDKLEKFIKQLKQKYAIMESSGHIPKNEKEAHDPRWSNALTVDVGPGEDKKQAAKWGFAVSNSGPPKLRSNGKA